MDWGSSGAVGKLVSIPFKEPEAECGSANRGREMSVTVELAELARGVSAHIFFCFVSIF